MGGAVKAVVGGQEMRGETAGGYRGVTRGVWLAGHNGSVRVRA